MVYNFSKDQWWFIGSLIEEEDNLNHATLLFEKAKSNWVFIILPYNLAVVEEFIFDANNITVLASSILDVMVLNIEADSITTFRDDEFNGTSNVMHDEYARVQLQCALKTRKSILQREHIVAYACSLLVARNDVNQLRLNFILRFLSIACAHGEVRMQWELVLFVNENNEDKMLLGMITDLAIFILDVEGLEHGHVLLFPLVVSMPTIWGSAAINLDVLNRGELLTSQARAKNQQARRHTRWEMKVVLIHFNYTRSFRREFTEFFMHGVLVVEFDIGLNPNPIMIMMLISNWVPWSNMSCEEKQWEFERGQRSAINEHCLRNVMQDEICIQEGPTIFYFPDLFCTRLIRCRLHFLTRLLDELIFSKIKISYPCVKIVMKDNCFVVQIFVNSEDLQPLFQREDMSTTALGYGAFDADSQDFLRDQIVGIYSSYMQLFQVEFEVISMTEIGSSSYGELRYFSCHVKHLSFDSGTTKGIPENNIFFYSPEVFSFVGGNSVLIVTKSQVLLCWLKLEMVFSLPGLRDNLTLRTRRILRG